MSSLNNVSSGQNLRTGSGKEPLGGSAGGPPPPPNEDATLYEKLTWAHKYDPRSKEEVILNRRVGFYRFKSDLGAGNFSKVKLAHHQLTKGMENLILQFTYLLLTNIQKYLYLIIFYFAIYILITFKYILVKST